MISTAEREEIFRGHSQWRNVGDGTPQILHDRKQTRSRFCNFCSSLIVRQTSLVYQKETEIMMFLHANVLESYHALTNPHFLAINNKIIERKMHNSEFTGT